MSDVPGSGSSALTPPAGGSVSSSTRYPVQSNPWRSYPQYAQFLDTIQNFLAQIDLGGVMPSGAQGSVGTVSGTLGGAGVVSAWLAPASTSALLRSKGSGADAAWTQIVTGLVDSTGLELAGDSGFSVNKTGTGVYAITYTTAFSATPLTVATAWNTSSLKVPVLSVAGMTGFTLKMYQGSGAAVDEGFNFLSMSFA